MKKIMLFTAMLLAGAAAMAQEVLRPSGNIITRAVTVKPFTAIKANGLYELILVQGSGEGVKVETDDNLQSLIEVSNSGDTLVVDEPRLRDRSFRFANSDREGDKKQHFKVYISFKNLTSLDIQNIGNTHSSGALTFNALQIKDKAVGNIDLQLTADKLMISNSGVGNINLQGKVENAIITNTGVGSFKGDGLLVQTMSITNTGVGHAEVNVVKSLMVKDSFLGKVKNSGAAKTIKLQGQEI